MCGEYYSFVDKEGDKIAADPSASVEKEMEQLTTMG